MHSHINIKQVKNYFKFKYNTINLSYKLRIAQELINNVTIIFNRLEVEVQQKQNKLFVGVENLKIKVS